MKNKKIFLPFFAGLCISVIGASHTFAFFTNYEERNNILSVGCNTTQIEEDFPNPSPVNPKENPKIKKKVRISNPVNGVNGNNISCYVRVALSYSDSTIGNAVILENLDTNNWSYNSSDGYYYYKHIIAPGKSTTDLFTGVSIDSKKVDTAYLDSIQNFSINVYEESIQAEGFINYQKAWDGHPDSSSKL